MVVVVIIFIAAAIVVVVLFLVVVLFVPATSEGGKITSPRTSMTSMTLASSFSVSLTTTGKRRRGYRSRIDRIASVTPVPI
jgi:flagellar basal body-associated protein FliL